MKSYSITLSIILVSFFVFYRAGAQTMQFTENKGQWDAQVKYKGELTNGAFFLHKNGYTVALHDPDDMRRVNAYFGGHSHAGMRPGPPKNAADATAFNRKLPENNPGTQTNELILHSHAYRVSFENASDNPQILPDKPLPTYHNYFIGKDSTKWASGCQIFQAVVYKNIYPNIDIRYYTENEHLKYDIIINPGGDINNVVMQFNGADKLSIKNGELHIQTSVGEVTELKPYSYQAGLNGRKEVKARYVISNNTVRFGVEAYDKSQTLVIDPSWIASVLTGSSADNWGYTATYDSQGNMYSGGIVFDTGFPVTPGAYQIKFAGGKATDAQGSSGPGGYDIGLVKFNPNGTRLLFATYLGGSDNEQPHSLIVDNNGNLLIAGRTRSRDFPGTSVTTTGELFDIFVAKLNSTGTTLLNAVRIGGSGDDGVNIASKYPPDQPFGAVSLRRNYGDDARSEVIVDNSNNVYVVAQTQSSNFPVTANAFQRSSGGKQDAVILKFSSSLTLLFASYLGGSGDDAAFVLSLNPINNNIYVAGGTTSGNFPGVGNSPVLFNAFQGGVCDGFVSIIGNNGSDLSLITSSYFGTSGSDLIFGIQFDKAGFPYIMGTTTGAWKITDNAAFKQPNGKQFISKLQPDLNGWVYSTVFGKGQAKPDISPTAFLVDQCENVYVSGWGGDIQIRFGYENSGTNGLTTTPDAIVPNSSARDGADFYFFVLKKDATAQLYGSMFGQTGGSGDHVDGGTSRFDKQGIIYQAICANCGGGVVFPTAPTGTAYNRNGAAPRPPQEGGGCNLATVKIAFELSGIHAGLRSSIDGVIGDTSGCIPLKVDFADTMALGKTYKWLFGDGSDEVTTTTPNTSHTYTQVGDYRVRLVTIDPESCNVSDTAYITIRARQDKANISFTPQKLPPCESLQYRFINTSTAPPAKPFTDTSFAWNLGDGVVISPTGTQAFNHTYAAEGTYKVTLRLRDTSYCNYNDSVVQELHIAAYVKADFETPATGCAPYTAFFKNTSRGGLSYTWDFGDNTSSQETNPSHLYSTPGTYTVKLTAVDPGSCNVQDVISKTILVSASPQAGFSFGPVPPQENTPVTFTNTSTGAVSYNWLFGDGDTLHTVSHDTLVQHIYNETNTFSACLVAINQYGCTDTVCKPVKTLIVPLIDVPNAFTPNGDGVNDIVRVRGFGISKVNFRIYNRWGVLVFQSSNAKNNGWDGRYKGVLQPQDVYTYIADIVFTDGTSYQKKGDITLLR